MYMACTPKFSLHLWNYFVSHNPDLGPHWFFFYFTGLISDKLILELCQIWQFILLHQQFALSYGAIIINKLMERIAHLEGLIDLSTEYENKK